MRVADVISGFVARSGLGHVFTVVGGGAMHLNDAFSHQAGLRAISVLHEQAAVIAAEAYGRVLGLPGVAVVTSGPGSTNAITGVAGAWQDSIPLVVLSGQVKRPDLSRGKGVRQLGVQEIDIVELVRPITKYAVTVLEPGEILVHLHRAWHEATTGRPGPVWLDLPLDVQASPVDLDNLASWRQPANCEANLSSQLDALLGRLASAQRPVLLLGNGIRLAGAAALVPELVERLGVPVLTTWPGMDLLPTAHPLCFGRPGVTAPRHANFTLQNADWLLAIGTRLDLVVTAFAPAHFARGAWRAAVDIDAAELSKVPGLLHLPIQADAGDFLRQLLSRDLTRWEGEDWIRRCRGWKARYPLEVPPTQPAELSTYRLGQILSGLLGEGELIVPGSSGLGLEIFLLTFQTKSGQRVFNTTGLGAMGYGIPAAIGAAQAAPGRRVISVDGEGGFFMNIQELETLRRLGLPVKLLVINNGGYASIRASQSRFFKRLSGADPSSGLTLPDVCAVSRAFGVETVHLDPSGDVESQLRKVLATGGPVVCEIPAPADEPRMPAVASHQRPDGSMVSRPMEDLWPFLPREEFRAQMIVPPLPESGEPS